MCDTDADDTLARLSEQEQQAALQARLSACAVALVKQHGWSHERVASTLDRELRQRLAECATDDAAFRAWYRQWREDNPAL